MITGLEPLRGCLAGYDPPNSLFSTKPILFFLFAPVLLFHLFLPSCKPSELTVAYFYCVILLLLLLLSPQAVLEFAGEAAKCVSISILCNVAMGATMYRIPICADEKLVTAIIRCLLKGELKLKKSCAKLLTMLCESMPSFALHTDEAVVSTRAFAAFRTAVAPVVAPALRTAVGPVVGGVVPSAAFGLGGRVLPAIVC